jgi:hypothetical protein
VFVVVDGKSSVVVAADDPGVVGVEAQGLDLIALVEGKLAERESKGLVNIQPLRVSNKIRSYLHPDHRHTLN